MHLTYFGSNSWLLEFGQKNILIDPWLVDSLVFGNLPWFFKADKPPALDRLPERIDLILLSQGLDDHTHRPTLEKLDKTIPVVSSQNAAAVVRQLGYTQVTPLAFGQTFTLADEIEIRALPGAPIGPFLQENAYLVKQFQSGTSLYYEPHGYPPEQLKEYAPVDVVISPVVTLELPLLGPIIQGHRTALQLAQWVEPQVFLPTAFTDTDTDVVKYEGVLNSWLRLVGSLEELRSQLAQHHLSTQVMIPQFQEALELNLVPQIA